MTYWPVTWTLTYSPSCPSPMKWPNEWAIMLTSTPPQNYPHFVLEMHFQVFLSTGYLIDTHNKRKQWSIKLMKLGMHQVPSLTDFSDTVSLMSIINPSEEQTAWATPNSEQLFSQCTLQRVFHLTHPGDQSIRELKTYCGVGGEKWSRYYKSQWEVGSRGGFLNAAPHDSVQNVYIGLGNW